jgi:hypothetical protein
LQQQETAPENVLVTMRTLKARRKPVAKPGISTGGHVFVQYDIGKVV